jgi:hypothetical protein
VIEDPSSSTQLDDVALVVDNALQQFPQPAGLKSGNILAAVDDTGFSYDCASNTPWKPIWCSGFGGAYGGYYFG